MKFVTFQDPKGNTQYGITDDLHVYPLGEEFPRTMLEFIQNHNQYMSQLNISELDKTHLLKEVNLLAPLPNPPSIRDFMAFEEHIVNAAKQIGIEVAEAWYEIPAFYFTNHLVVSGHQDHVERPPKCMALDYELEMACVIGKEGKNIKASEAEDYIFGYTILNDWSARDLQAKEMKVGLGPAKGKDFATSIGPYIVTKDELEPYKLGDRYDLDMVARVNGTQLSKGNFKDIHYTFGDMIERASDGVTLYPGDIIGSGTVGTGCILELGEEGKWLEIGDTVELEITGLGKLENRVKT
ncbi:fumarylacetoacetate hydrolase family protein [Piscibacillus sp. B03]|uniref:fumarylacetoacetate hydrolase family protein n=1 Tax=Piscibacillus sp. B03 TaxID=3457430 RepID=UPI003FCDA516